MSHYISDVAVWAHVRGKGSLHGPEDSKKHSEYENEIDKTFKANFFSDPDHTSRVFQSYMVFDGVYNNVTAYEAAYILGLNTDSGGGGLDCIQMELLLPMGPNGDGSGVGVDDWPKDYKDRAGESLNFAANTVADVLYKLNRESGKIEAQPTVTQTVKETPAPAPTETSPAPSIPSLKINSKLGAMLALLTILTLLLLLKGKGKKRSRKRRRK